MNISVANDASISVAYTKLLASLDGIAANIGFDGFGIIGDTSTKLRAQLSQASTYFQISAGS